MDFQGLYLRRSVSRDKSEWAIVGFQLDLLAECIFNDDTKIMLFNEINDFLVKLRFIHIRGPERGKISKEVRTLLEGSFGDIKGLSKGLFKKKLDRIIWELITYVPLAMIQKSLEATIIKH
jgi:hypothetical protein